MAAEDQTDADFFDNLVGDDDVTVSASGESMARALSSLSLGDDLETDPEAEAPVADVAPAAAQEKEVPKLASARPFDADVAPADIPAVDVEPSAGSVGSVTKAAAGVTHVKQVQWTVFGSGGGGGATSDPFSELSSQEAFSGNDAGFGNAFGAADVGFGGANDDPFVNFSQQQDGITDAKTEFGAGSVYSQDGQCNGTVAENTAEDVNDPQNWESMYPGWKYDMASGQWYQVDTFDTSLANAQVDHGSSVFAGGSSGSLGTQEVDSQFNVSYLHNSTQAVLETVTEESTMGNVSNWNQDAAAEVQMQYPPNMVFAAEYPGWYYDTNTQQWYSFESYLQATAAAAAQAVPASTVQEVAGTGVGNSDAFGSQNHNMGQFENTAIHNQGGQEFGGNMSSFGNSYTQGTQWQPQAVGNNSGQAGGFPVNQLSGSFYDSMGHTGSHMNQQTAVSTFVPSTSYTQTGHMGFQPSTVHQNDQFKPFQPSNNHQSAYQAKTFQPSTSYQQTHFKPVESSFSSRSYDNVNGGSTQKSFAPERGMLQNQQHPGSFSEVNPSNSYYGSQNSTSFPQQPSQPANASYSHTGYANASYSHTGYMQRSSDGRPPHAIITFGFGGRFVVMKDTSSSSTKFDNGNQGTSGATVTIINLSDIVVDKLDASSAIHGSAFSYFHALCRQPIPGPLVGGNAATKDVNKWLDERIATSEPSISEFQRGDNEKLLFSLLKILCQHYGKLRSPFGSDPSQEETDGPDQAVTKLFSSAKSSVHMHEYGSLIQCMRNLPSEGQMQSTAVEVQNLLVSGRRKEALQCAQEGQLWGPALVLALQLGDLLYADTVRKMAHCHFVSGSPLKTLCLLIAGHPLDAFSVENSVNNAYAPLNAPQQNMQFTPGGMLDDWEENLAIITANRTKDDELVMTHLGDCLWKDKKEVIAAHTCYLVAERNIESYSETARICLIGADHLKCPRTFASPEAIQRTEIYEYAKVLGNSQYILLPFQPYKLIYAYMLAEMGKVSDSLRYCQASLKLLKSSGRAPELEIWKQLFSSLEDRLRTHQQGGYGTNLASAKFVGKIFNTLDKSLSRMMGAPPAQLPPMPQGFTNNNGAYAASAKVVNSQSEIGFSTLMPSVSVGEGISEMVGSTTANTRKMGHNRSASEPDFGKSPKQTTGSDGAKGNASGSGGSRFGWLGSTLQKIIPRPPTNSRQAKLGEQNKFRYDEKLKRWVEEGAEAVADEPPLAPPPTTASFQNGMPDYNLNGPNKSESHLANGFPETKPLSQPDHSLGMPPIPPSQNQFSARSRMGVRSRYVDTFNKGGTSAAATNMFQSPVASSIKPPAGAKFFVPGAPVGLSEEQKTDPASESNHGLPINDEPSSSAPTEASFSSPPPPPSAASVSSSMPRYPSMDQITPHGNRGSAQSSRSGDSSFSRGRAASWSGGTFPDSFTGKMAEAKPIPDGQNFPSPFMPGNPSNSRSNSNSSVWFNGSTEDLHDVEL